jgi:phospholipid/cholesterol/gamma-HCH transport system ATP-binding protein
MIQLIDVYKTFRNKDVLRGASLHIERGESMVVIGGSGCGKSVLMKHVIGLLWPDRGQVMIDGKDLSSCSRGELREIRKKFGMLFQGSALFDSMTVGQNVGFGLKEHTSLSKEEIREKVREKLQMVGLPGIDALRPDELSGGMKKRVGLARAIAMEPEILLYDEPTTGLDPIMSDVINDLIVRLKETYQVTSLAITHDMTSAYKIADRIGMLYEGRIIEVGTPEEIQNTKNPVVRQFITGSAKGPITEGACI